MVCLYSNPGKLARCVFSLVIILFCSNSGAFAFQNPALPTAEEIAKAKLTWQIIGKEGGYGYDIFMDGRKLIHQPQIPGIQGNAGFKSKADSQKVAELVISKLKKGEMPPTVTEAELRKLKVIN